ncbi:MAG: hypothetical protein LV468_05235 [Candidatus Nitrosotenuis sp.]|nr:hypothetical protein [Candidatus Nitrosotenuis sp.]
MMCGGDHLRNARICAEEGSAIITESKREREQLKILKEKVMAEKLRQAFTNDKTHTQRLSMLGTESELSDDNRRRK